MLIRPPLSDFITHTAQDCAAWGVPYCDHELEACTLAFNRLLTVSSPAQARLLFDELVTEALHRVGPQDPERPWAWVAAELDVETVVAWEGNRRRAAIEALEETGRLDDAALDLFNDRMSRPAAGCAQSATHREP